MSTNKADNWIKELTPNWPNSDERYSSVTVTVKITCDGRGLTREQAAKLCKRLENTATGRSKTRTVSAIV